MKMLLLLCIAVIGIAVCTPAFGQTKKDGLFSFLQSKKKAKEYFKTDSLKPAVVASQPACNFRQESEDEHIVYMPGYVIGNDFVITGSVKVFPVKLFSYGFQTPIGMIVFNPYSASWYPNF